MKALVVYESMFGNTEQIARAVATGLSESVDVQLSPFWVTQAPAKEKITVKFLVDNEAN